MVSIYPSGIWRLNSLIFNNVRKIPKCSCSDTRFHYNKYISYYSSFCNECISIGAILHGDTISLTTTFWDFAHTNTSERIKYNNNLKVNQIKRILEKCETENTKIKNELIKAEHQINYYRILETYFINYRNKVKNNKNFDYYTRYIIEEKQTCIVLYLMYRNYYYKIPSIKNKYMKLLNAHKSKVICYECFVIVNTEIKKKKKKNYCGACFNKRVNLRIIRECPVCLEKFNGENSSIANCGNSHYFCNSCYYGVKMYSSKCPMCRGTL